jgi:molybdopterin synthase sulfur carrier subunit
MRVRVKVFATLSRHFADRMPGVPFEAEVPDQATVEDLVERLKLPREEVKAVFVNGRAQPLSYALNPGDEIGIFPPIGGG